MLFISSFPLLGLKAALWYLERIAASASVTLTNSGTIRLSISFLGLFSNALFRNAAASSSAVQGMIIFWILFFLMHSLTFFVIPGYFPLFPFFSAILPAYPGQCPS